MQGIIFALLKGRVKKKLRGFGVFSCSVSPVYECTFVGMGERERERLRLSTVRTG